MIPIILNVDEKNSKNVEKLIVWVWNSFISACLCKHGECDSGLNGTGHCKLNTCLLGYTGPDCNISKLCLFIAQWQAGLAVLHINYVKFELREVQWPHR